MPPRPEQARDAVAPRDHRARQEAAFIDAAGGAQVRRAGGAAAQQHYVSAEVASSGAAQQAQKRLFSAHS